MKIVRAACHDCNFSESKTAALDDGAVVDEVWGWAQHHADSTKHVAVFERPDHPTRDVTYRRYFKSQLPPRINPLNDSYC